jgi:dethiobiotin synthetase
MAMRGWFVTSTGTNVGKTWVSRALLLGLRAHGVKVAGLKPIETGCAPSPRDALALADASGRATLAHSPRWYRAELPASPYAVELETGFPPPRIEAVVEEVGVIANAHEAVLVEGAGGLLVPLDREHSMADLALALGLPLLLVAEDKLGVLSHVLTAAESAERRGLRIGALILNQALAVDPEDPSIRTNRTILAERLGVPVLSLPHLTQDDPTALAAAAEQSGLVTLGLEMLGRAG